MKDNALILLLKEPEVGKVKTRLGKSIGMKKAMHVYIGFLEMLSEIIIHESWETLIYFSGTDSPKRLKAIFGSEPKYKPQISGNLGDKIKGAFKETFNMSYSKAVIMGGDSPDLPNHLIKDGFSFLKYNDVVLGPTLDGGYYLLGMNQLHTNLFHDIAWSTSSVYKKTIEKIHKESLTYKSLVQWNDIDTIKDYNLFLIKQTITN